MDCSHFHVSFWLLPKLSRSSGSQPPTWTSSFSVWPASVRVLHTRMGWRVFPWAWTVHQWLQHWRKCYPTPQQPLIANRPSGRVGPHRSLCYPWWNGDRLSFVQVTLAAVNSPCSAVASPELCSVSHPPVSGCTTMFPKPWKGLWGCPP